MKIARLLSLAILAASGLALGACSSTSKVEARTTTVGQELQDLDEARDKGLLTEDEYQAKRKEIMNRK